ncbi:GNAT family N-acetyltransferase [Nocardia sp. NPDC058640]|uniref:GNAT family N-acetyltransferase n=1 Tax=Nocardia sp. NPDC058640 TaxID=3346571 RepID=UPI003653F222
MWNIEIVDGTGLDVSEVQSLYRASTLAERRPSDDSERLRSMLVGSNLIATARIGDRLVGLSRSLTDTDYVTYLCDLAVHADFQRMGIGKDLIRATAAAAPRSKIVLLSAPDAMEYYPRIGFNRHNSAWVLDALK